MTVVIITMVVVIITMVAVTMVVVFTMVTDRDGGDVVSP